MLDVHTILQDPAPAPLAHSTRLLPPPLPHVQYMQPARRLRASLHPLAHGGRWGLPNAEMLHLAHGGRWGSSNVVMLCCIIGASERSPHRAGEEE